MGHAIAHIIAELLGLPDWSPRLVQKVAAWSILFTAMFMPVVFREGLTIWVNQETTQIMKWMEPVLFPTTPELSNR